MNVHSVQYTGFPKGLRYFPGFLQRYFIKRKFDELQMLCGVDFDIVWSFDNSVFFNFSALPKRVLKISHIVDLNQNFQTGLAAATADVCFCTTDQIRTRLMNFSSNVHKINHGFNAGALEAPTMTLPGDSRKKVLYAGNLAMPYIDWSIISIVVRDNPETDFIFVGPDAEGQGDENAIKLAVRESKNAYFIGRVSADSLQGYYRSADVLMVAYQERYHDDQANPHKMMEYLGSGKAVVATFTGEYLELHEKGLISMSKSNRDFPGNVAEVLGNLEHWNADARQALRRQWALDNAYDNQLERIQRLLKS
jgi:glycosyltransferase involved in cell wall biosynthesis